MTGRLGVHTVRAKYFLNKQRSITTEQSKLEIDIKKYNKGTAAADLEYGWYIIHCIGFLRWAHQLGEPGAAALSEAVCAMLGEQAFEIANVTGKTSNKYLLTPEAVNRSARIEKQGCWTWCSKLIRRWGLA